MVDQQPGRSRLRVVRALHPSRRDSIPIAVAQFAITGLLAVVIVGLAGVALLRRVGNAEAQANARQLTTLAGDGIVAPVILPGLERGDQTALSVLDQIVRGRVLRDPVVRVKVWDDSGRILYSDEPRLIGQRFALEPDEHRALSVQGSLSQISDLNKPENRYERRDRQLLEVYHGIRGPHGQQLLFEAYLRYSSVAASGRHLWSEFAPALLGGLLALELVQIPLALSLARRLRRGQDEREGLLHRAVAAEDMERQRIARDLHDGVVQNLAGVSYSLAAASERLPRADHTVEARKLIDGAAAEARRSVRALRTLLVDLYPPDLHRAGLPAALEGLLDGLGGPPPEVRFEADPGLRLPQDTEALMFRVAQEALRNVASHSQAATVDVAVGRENGTARLLVRDDGIGFPVTAEGRPPRSDTQGAGAPEHFGLRIVTELAHDAGGELQVHSAPGEGTEIRLNLPVR